MQDGVVSSETAVVPAGPDGQLVVARLWQLFWHDLSEFRDRPPDGDGTFPVHDLPTFFGGDPHHRAYLIKRGGALGGFVLVNQDSAGLQHLHSFFVVRALRRQRIGHSAATAVLRGQPGRWQIGFQEENFGAACFWRQVATSTVGSRWHEELRPVPDKPWLPFDRFILFET